MAQIARPEADKATNTAKERPRQGRRAGQADHCQDRRGHAKPGQAENVARDGLQSVRQAVDAAAEVGQKTVRPRRCRHGRDQPGLMELFTEQARHNVQLFQTLAQPANWGKAAQLQSEFLRSQLAAGSSVRPALCRGQPAVMTSALATARGQAKKVA